MDEPSIRGLAGIAVLTLALTGCGAISDISGAASGAGDIAVDFVNEFGGLFKSGDGDTTTDTTTTTAGADTTPACASYTLPETITAAGETRTGVLTDRHCIYNVEFVDTDRPLSQSISLESLSGGAHIFEGSLVVGTSHETQAALTGANISEGGDAPSLAISAGAIIAFGEVGDGLIINRGARIMAIGTQTDPILFTSEDDVRGEAGTTAADGWAGIIINGFGLTNACTYAAPAADTEGNVPPRRPFVMDQPFMPADPQPTLRVTGECSQGTDATGRHGGTNNADSSGTLAYVILKHSGLLAAQNALALNAVGRGTTLNNIEVFAAANHAGFSDGVRLTGGAASLTQVLVYNPKLDGIRLTNGYLGTLETILVSQADSAGERCIHVESGTGGQSEAQINDGMNTRVMIAGLTCDISVDHARGSGVILEEGAQALLQNAIIVGSRLAADASAPNDNACLEIIGDRSTIEAEGVIISCKEQPLNALPAHFLDDDTGATGVTVRVTATDDTKEESIQFAAIPTAATTFSPLAAIDSAFVALSASGTEDGRPLFSLFLSDTRVNDADTTVQAAGEPAPTFLGAAATDNNPFARWTFGVFAEVATSFGTIK